MLHSVLVNRSESPGVVPSLWQRVVPSSWQATALALGSDDSLIASLTPIHLWNLEERWVLKGVARSRRINVPQKASGLGLTEFNTWYVRGLTRRLLEEGVTLCQVYRGANPKWESAECSDHEGQIYAVDLVYRGHRLSYWPEPGDPTAVSIPFGTGCHHTVRRYT